MYLLHNQFQFTYLMHSQFPCTYLLHSQFQSCPFLLAICWTFVIIIVNSLCAAFCYQRFAKGVVFYHCWPSRFLKLLNSRVDVWLVAFLSNIVLHCLCSHLLDGYSYFIHFMIYVKQIIWNCLYCYNIGISIRKHIVNLCWHSAISHLSHLAPVFELLTSLARYELLTPNVIPKGFMDGRKACQKMVCVL